MMKLRNTPFGALGLLAALASSPAFALDGDPAASPANPNTDAFQRACQCSPVADAALAALRGGFDDGHGLTASIGLERLTVVNDIVVSTATLHIGDLSKVTAQQMQQLQTTLAAVGIVNGAGNLNALQGAAAGTTVIQNTLDKQSIRNATVLNISTNSLQLLKAANLQITLQDALKQALPGH